VIDKHLQAVFRPAQSLFVSFRSNGSYWLQHSLSPAHSLAGEISHSIQTQLPTLQITHLAEISISEQHRFLSSPTDTNDKNTKSTDTRGEIKKINNKPCVPCGKWVAIRWLTLNIPQSHQLTLNTYASDCHQLLGVFLFCCFGCIWVF